MRTSLIATAVLVAAIAYGQDSTKHRPIAIDQVDSTQRPSLKVQESSPARVSDDYRDEDRVLIQPDQLPLTIKATLANPEYSGWENSSLYQDRVSGDYIVEIKNTTGLKSYRFDTKGKLLEDPNKPRRKQ